MGKYEECIENLINGNLRQAKKQAENLGVTTLSATMKEGYGFSDSKAAKAIIYFLDPCEETYQFYCDQK